MAVLRVDGMGYYRWRQSEFRGAEEIIGVGEQLHGKYTTAAPAWATARGGAADIA